MKHTGDIIDEIEALIERFTAHHGIRPNTLILGAAMLQEVCAALRPEDTFGMAQHCYRGLSIATHYNPCTVWIGFSEPQEAV